MEQMTIKKLKKLVDQQIKRGNGDKYIVISDDNEGNGYHGLFYGFNEDKRDVYMFLMDETIHDTIEEDENNIIILG